MVTVNLLIALMYMVPAYPVVQLYLAIFTTAVKRVRCFYGTLWYML